MRFLTEYFEEKLLRTSRERYRNELLSDIDRVTKKLSEIQNSYDLASDDDLIDAIIYEERSLQARYTYLLKLARQNNIICGTVIR